MNVYVRKVYLESVFTFVHFFSIKWCELILFLNWFCKIDVVSYETDAKGNMDTIVKKMFTGWAN